MAGTWEDEKIAKLVSLGGKEALALYGAYWRILEIVASQMKSGSSQCSVTYGVTRWSVLLSVRGSHLSHYISHLSKSGLVTAEWIETDLRVTIPNLLKYRDEYAKKSRQSPKSIPSITEGELEGELDTDVDSGSVSGHLDNSEWVTPLGKWTSDQCVTFLKHVHWNPARPDETNALIQAVDPVKLPDEEEDPDTLAGILFRLIQFDVAWGMYWNRSAKKKAQLAWMKATRDFAAVQEIQDAIEAQSPEMLERELKHRPHMATFLNGERWKDEVQPRIEGRSAWGAH